MTVHMDVEAVRTGGIGLRGLAPNGQAASRRVERPASTAADRNRGFATGEAGRRWQAALAAVTAGLEHRLTWQGDQVVGSADDVEAVDQEARTRFGGIQSRFATGPTR
ncbi:hypothetical protein K3N28_16585 [Glycomyces sp. TRM65418]|uniref:hypothetical protein n=1 Tax=Glycomyces sp. TRM65418 TaxID=2867006 RepID=UPI001CE53686|nr:hypothetical protein [Glycomyces sp. TRM65418]MCC3764676.1 hypothetical protein [Glycomyces sp. TRM65418]QZD54336.1 hypothetical protein K3N28_16500 [Glycomyces sp. TRM65418]